MNNSQIKILYIGSEIVIKILPFLALPVFVNYLSKEEFGIVANFNVLFFIFSIIVGLSTEGYFSTKFYNSSTAKRALILGNLIIIATITFLILLPVIFVLRYFIFQFFNIHLIYLFLCIVATYFNFIIKLYLIHCRFSERHTVFLVYQFTLVTLNIILSILAIIYLKDKLFARIFSLSISYVLLGVLALCLLGKFAIFKLNYILSFKLIKFGVPLIPYQLAKWGRNGIDRLIITNFVGIAANGVYSYNFQISNIPTYIGSSLNLELTPQLFKLLAIEKDLIIVMNFLRPYVFMILIAFFGYVIGILFFKEYIFMKGFKFDFVTFFLIIIGSLFHSFSLLLNNFFFYWQKNILITRITLLASVGGVILNLCLTSAWDIYGTCVTFFIVEIVIFIILLFFVIKEFRKNIKEFGL